MIRPPSANVAATQYARRLRALLKAWYDRVEDLMRSQFRADAAGVRADAVDTDALKIAFDDLVRANGIDGWLGRVAKSLAENQGRYVQRVAKLPAAGPNVTPQALEAFRQANARLVTKMRDDQIEALADILRPAQAAGQRWEEIAPQIQARLGIGERRARLIARDQMTSWQAQANMTAQTSAGITEYTWSTSRDKAVRGRPGGVYEDSKEDHWALEGTRQRWDRPPKIPGIDAHAHPGERIQCRCVAIPVIGLFDEPAPTLRAKPAAPRPPRDERKAPIPAKGAPARVALEGLDEAGLSFLREGYRPKLRIYEGVAPDQIDAIATGRVEPPGSVTKLPPITVAFHADGQAPVLVDGRHRLEAAQAAGAQRILAKLRVYGPNGGLRWEGVREIPVPRPDPKNPHGRSGLGFI